VSDFEQIAESVNRKIRSEAARDFADVFEMSLRQGRYRLKSGDQSVMEIIALLRNAAESIEPKPGIILPDGTPAQHKN